MKAARILILGVALAAGGVAAYLVTSEEPPPAPPPVAAAPTDEVLVASSDIGIGQAVSAQTLRWQAWGSPAPLARTAVAAQSHGIAQFHSEETTAERHGAADRIDRAYAFCQRRADPRGQADQGQRRVSRGGAAGRNAGHLHADIARDRGWRLHPAERPGRCRSH